MNTVGFRYSLKPWIDELEGHDRVVEFIDALRIQRAGIVQALQSHEGIVKVGVFVFVVVPHTSVEGRVDFAFFTQVEL